MVATEVKNSFGKMLKLLDYEDIVVTKNGRAIAKITKYSEPLDTYGIVKETAPEYIASDRKVSYEEFLKIVTSDDKRYELINGQVYMQASPTYTHQRICSCIHGYFDRYFADKECEPFFAPFDISLKVDEKISVVQPDVGVICNPDEDLDDKDRYMGTPKLVVEVMSKPSMSRDMVDKLTTYMYSGIEEYWVVDPINGTNRVYRFRDNEIADYKEFKEEEPIKSFMYEGLEVSY